MTRTHIRIIHNFHDVSAHRLRCPFFDVVFADVAVVIPFPVPLFFFPRLQHIVTTLRRCPLFEAS